MSESFARFNKDEVINACNSKIELYQSKMEETRTRCIAHNLEKKPKTLTGRTRVEADALNDLFEEWVGYPWSYLQEWITRTEKLRDAFLQAKDDVFLVQSDTYIFN